MASGKVPTIAHLTGDFHLCNSDNEGYKPLWHCKGQTIDDHQHLCSCWRSNTLQKIIYRCANNVIGVFNLGEGGTAYGVDKDHNKEIGLEQV